LQNSRDGEDSIERLNFSWPIDGEIAGHAAPLNADDLVFLRDKGIKGLVRMAEKRATR